MLALIDSDTPIYKTALVSEEVDLSIAKCRLDVSIDKILNDSGCSSYILFVSGSGNFRKEIDSTYKVNRTQPDPRHREALRLHLLEKWNAVECNGYEADDGCGAHQKTDGSTIICGIDKDLLQIPGKHYQWPIVRKGEIIRPALFHDISVEQGWRNFFTQMLTGDTSDNIIGVVGIGTKKAEKYLCEQYTEDEMYYTVKQLYWASSDDEEQRCCNMERFKRNLDLLYIWRTLGITYNIRKEIYDNI